MIRVGDYRDTHTIHQPTITILILITIIQNQTTHIMGMILQATITTMDIITTVLTPNYPPVVSSPSAWLSLPA